MLADGNSVTAHNERLRQAQAYKSVEFVLFVLTPSC